ALIQFMISPPPRRCFIRFTRSRWGGEEAVCRLSRMEYACWPTGPLCLSASPCAVYYFSFPHSVLSHCVFVWLLCFLSRAFSYSKRQLPCRSAYCSSPFWDFTRCFILLNGYNS